MVNVFCDFALVVQFFPSVLVCHSRIATPGFSSAFRTISEPFVAFPSSSSPSDEVVIPVGATPERSIAS